MKQDRVDRRHGSVKAGSCSERAEGGGTGRDETLEGARFPSSNGDGPRRQKCRAERHLTP